MHPDSYHMNIEEVAMASGIADAGEHLGYVHASEANRGVPGRGTLDWAGLCQGLAEAEFEGPVVLESFVHLDPDIAAGLAVWRAGRGGARGGHRRGDSRSCASTRRPRRVAL